MSATVILRVSLSAAAYAMVMYAQKHGKENPEDFDPTKFFATILTGIALGIVAWSMGDPMSQEAMGVQLFTYAGATNIFESLLKSGWRFIKKQIG